MPSFDGSLLRAAETAFALAVLLVAGLIATAVPWFPSWPTLAGFPVDPELVVPGLLGLAALARAVADGLGIVSVAVGLLGVATVLFAALSLRTLYTYTGGGVFMGGLFTLAAGVPLAVVVLARNAARELGRRGVAEAPARFRNRDR